MPLRAIGYAASALTIAAAYLPKAQVQIVHTLHANQRINGTHRAFTRAEAERFAGKLGQILHEGQQLTHLVDPTEPLITDQAAVADALRAHMPAPARDKLLAEGRGRGEALAYIAAHVDMHDTKAALSPLRTNDAAPIRPQRIISLGAQSERPFYLARMACRDAGLDIPNAAPETGQLFTRHVLPPYRMCREGEPPIDDITFTPPLRQPLEWMPDPLYDIDQPNLSVRRDLAYVGHFLAGQEDPGITALLKMTDELRTRL